MKAKIFFGVILAFVFSSSASLALEPDFIYECEKYRDNGDQVFTKQEGSYTLEVGKNLNSFLGLGFGGAWFTLSSSEYKMTVAVESCMEWGGFYEMALIDDRCGEFYPGAGAGELGYRRISDNSEVSAGAGGLPHWYNTNLNISKGMFNGESEGEISTAVFRLSDEVVIRTEYRCTR